MSRHLREADLVLLHYRDGRYARPAARERAERHLATCVACHEAFAALGAVLHAVDAQPVPAREGEYGARVWARLAPRLAAEPAGDERREPAHAGWRLLWAGAALVMLAAGSFWAGRAWQQRFAGPAVQPSTSATAEGAGSGRQRILLAAVGDHLDRAQMLLVELAHAGEAEEASGAVSIASEQAEARELIAGNLLYRQAAMQQNQPGTAALLDDLGRALLAIAHSPAQLSAPEWRALRARLAAQGILFQVRVLEMQVRDEERVPPAAARFGEGI